MESSLPKQFIPVAGKPVLMHTFEVFYKFNKDFHFVLVLPEDAITTWKKLIREHNFQIPHDIVPGGTERFYSVKNGLSRIDHESLVAIHDGVRPLVAESVIEKGFGVAGKSGNAIPAIAVNESMREVSGPDNHPVDRGKFRLCQTPQVFNSSMIKKAYQQEYDNSFTDDATVLESMGVTINLIQGNRENIKITHHKDLKFAEMLLS